jgi:hypothetical protein
MSIKKRLLEGKDEGDERLLQLFWKRAELKKEFSRLREQRYRLEEMLKQQQAATLSSENRMLALEKLFANPEAGLNAIVYFQLRNLWHSNASELKRFSSELYKQREQRERQSLLMSFNRERNSRLAELAGQMEAVDAEINGLKKSLKSLHGELAAAAGIFGFFKRRPLRARIEEVRTALMPLTAKYEELNSLQSAVASQRPTEFEGLSIQGKRIANLGVISLAQCMHRYFERKGYAEKARDATIQPIEEIRYGTGEQCRRLMEDIPKAIAGMKSDPEFSDSLRSGAKALHSVASYLAEEDTIPRAESLDEASRNAKPGEGASCNVLVQNFWDIHSALIR